MNRRQFISTLKRELAKLPAGEVEDILSYYEEYFDEAGPDNEEAVIRELGSPVKIASQMKANYAVKQINNKKGKGTGISAVWWVILGALAAPIALPLALGIGAVLFAIVITVVILAFTALLLIAVLFIAGIALVVAGIASVGAGLGGALLGIGGGLMLIGIMLLSAFVVVVLVKNIFGWLARTVNKHSQRQALDREIRAKKAARAAEKTTQKQAEQGETDEKCDAQQEGQSSDYIEAKSAVLENKEVSATEKEATDHE